MWNVRKRPANSHTPQFVFLAMPCGKLCMNVMCEDVAFVRCKALGQIRLAVSPTLLQHSSRSDSAVGSAVGS